jgi:hypothetical protein
MLSRGAYATTGTMVNAVTRAMTADSSWRTSVASTNRKPKICTGDHGQGSSGVAPRMPRNSRG